MKHKVLAALLSVSVLVCLLVFQIGFLYWWQKIHDDRNRHDQIKQDLLRLERLAMDVDNQFRDYVLMKKSKFLTAMVGAESAIPALVERLSTMTAPWPDLQNQVRALTGHVNDLLQTRRRLSMDFVQGHEEDVLAYVKNGEGLELTNTISSAFRDVESKMDHSDQGWTQARDEVRMWTRLGLIVATLGTFVVGLVMGRSLSSRVRTIAACGIGHK